ncbi:Uncharacterised protein [Klebsiella pneumoniae]|nr:Uncharacterised protein [Klebsiella pneumoniae]
MSKLFTPYNLSGLALKKPCSHGTDDPHPHHE